MSLSARSIINDMQSGGNYFRPLRIPEGVEIYRPDAEGDVSLIVVPYKVTNSPRREVKAGDLAICRDYYIYRGLGPSGKDSYFDSVRTFREKCAIGEALARYSGPADRKPRAQRKCLFNVYIPDEKKLAVLDFSYANFAGRLLEAVDKLSSRKGKEWVQYFADPEEGALITFSWKKETMPSSGTTYYVATAFDFERHGGIPAKLIDSSVDLDNCFNKLSYDEVRAQFLDGAVDTSDMELKIEAKARKAIEQPLLEEPVGTSSKSEKVAFDDDWDS